VFAATYVTPGGDRQVWAVVSYHVTGPPPMGPGPAPTNTDTDEIVAFDAATLDQVLDLYALPFSCG
jgi:hypothetical protein